MQAQRSRQKYVGQKGNGGRAFHRREQARSLSILAKEFPLASLSTKRVIMQGTDEAARTYALGIERLRVGELLLEEAVARQQSAQTLEALELWAEAAAFKREGHALLEAALTQLHAQIVDDAPPHAR
jgi:hypothetical protein